MALKDLIDKSRTIHSVRLHGEKISFAELGYEDESLARAQGRKRAEMHDRKLTEDETAQYENLYVYLMMLRAGKEDISDDEFFSISSDYHGELMMAINNKLQSEVHIESGRLQRELRRRLKELTLEWDAEDNEVKAAASAIKKE